LSTSHTVKLKDKDKEVFFAFPAKAGTHLQTPEDRRLNWPQNWS